MQQPVVLSPMLGTKSSHIFTQSPQDVAVVCGILYLACQDEFFANNPLDIKDNDEYSSLSRTFSFYGLIT
jgi:hypothetical protein